MKRMSAGSRSSSRMTGSSLCAKGERENVPQCCQHLASKVSEEEILFLNKEIPAPALLPPKKRAADVN